MKSLHNHFRKEERKINDGQKATKIGLKTDKMKQIRAAQNIFCACKNCRSYIKICVKLEENAELPQKK